jgi:hypothetical protein
MDDIPISPVHEVRRSGFGLGTVLLVILLAFALGAGLVWYVLRDREAGLADLFSLRNEGPVMATMPIAATSRMQGSDGSSAAQVEATAARVEQVEEQTGGIDQRVAAMEQRLTRLDLQSQAAAGNAARAEGMLIAFAARRAIERGQPLGFLEDQLRLRFGDARPNAVQTVIDAARDPVTLDQLLVQIDGMGGELLAVPESEGLFTRLGHELSQLFSVRTDDMPSPVAERRLERARANLQNSQIERAISEVRALPNAPLAEEWLIDAERFAAAQRALEVLETAAVLEPRDLRDGDGQRVEQPGLISN